MRRLTLFFLVLTTLFSAKVMADESSRMTDGANSVITRTYNDIGNFDAISTNAVGDIYFTQTSDGSSSMRIIGNSEYLDKMKVVVIEGVLTINGPQSASSGKSGKRVNIGKKTDVTNSLKVRIDVSAPTLKMINSRGVGNIKIEKGLKVNELEIQNKGVGDIEIDGLKCKKLNVTLSGVGDVSLTGSADMASFSLSGVGDIQAYEFKVDDLTVVSRGVGDVKCTATKSINAECRGVGGINYKGSPKEKQIISKGIGSVKSK